MTSRPLVALVYCVLLVALLTRVWNAWHYPVLYDFDGPAHALNALALYRGELPDPAAWLGFHPPLYYAVSALLWKILPCRIPVHVVMRLLSLAAIVGAVAATAAMLRRVVSRDAAWVVAGTLAGVPAVGIAGSMLGNESAAVFFGSCTVALLLVTASESSRFQADEAPDRRMSRRRVTWLLAGLTLGLWSKASALLLLPVAAGSAAFWLRKHPPRAALSAAVLLGVPTLLAAPHYLRVVESSGSLLGMVSSGSVSDEVAFEMERQLPGERHLIDYVSVPAATFTHPAVTAPGMVRSVAGLLHASVWADPYGAFLPEASPAVMRATAGLSMAGLLPLGLALLGAAVCARRRRHQDRLALALAATFLASLASYVWLVPVFSAVKASYLLPALPVWAYFLAVGLDRLPRRMGRAVSLLLLVLALCASAVTTQGWWRKQIPSFESLAGAEKFSLESPEAAVVAYFETIGRDPIRSLEAVSDSFQLRHDLPVNGRRASDLVRRGRARRALDVGRAGWLQVQRLPLWRQLWSSLEYRVLAASSSGAQARVRVAVWRSDVLRGQLTIGLVKTRGEWRVDWIVPESSPAVPAGLLFAASPYGRPLRSIGGADRRQ